MTAVQSVVPSANVADGLPALISGAGDRAALRFLEFLTVNIRNRNTRAAYARAATAFLRWREGQGINDLGRIQPVHVAAYIELLRGRRSAPTVNQHSACIRMLFIKSKHSVMLAFKAIHEAWLLFRWADRFAFPLTSLFGVESPNAHTQRILVRLGYAHIDGENIVGTRCYFVPGM